MDENVRFQIEKYKIERFYNERYRNVLLDIIKILIFI